MRRALLIAALLLAASASQASAQIKVACFAPTLVSCNGVWHRSAVTIDWTVEAPWVAGTGCVDETLTQDTVGAARGCNADTPEGGDDVSRVITVKVDMTPPVVTGATASRPTDANGWYRSPLQVAFSGTDATSGLDGCTSATYSGPDSGSATVAGTCRDKAGNVSEASAFGLRYDATPPNITRVTTAPGDEEVRIGWDVADASAVELWRSPGLDGASQSVVNRNTDGSIVDRHVRNGRRYDYRLLAVDEAGNLAMRTFSATPGRRLLSPADGATVDGPPALRWTKVNGARYYNVQVLRNGRKLLTAWPGTSHYELKRRWRFNGHRFRLKPGRRYTWLVWPGRGKRSRNDYGPLIGRGTFTVAAS
jgi:hypothetical protein